MEWASSEGISVNIELKNNIFDYPYLEMKVSGFNLFIQDEGSNDDFIF